MCVVHVLRQLLLRVTSPKLTSTLKHRAHVIAVLGVIPHNRRRVKGKHRGEVRRRRRELEEREPEEREFEEREFEERRGLGKEEE